MNAEDFFTDEERQRIREIIATEDADPLTQTQSEELRRSIDTGEPSARMKRNVLRHHAGLLFAYNRVLYDDGSMARTLSIGSPIVPPAVVIRDLAMIWGFQSGEVEADIRELVPGHLYFIGLTQPLDGLAGATPEGHA